MTATATSRRTDEARTWAGQDFAAALNHAAAWLDVHRDEVNSLNVFPVPDGDTGTNMAMTMTAALATLPADEPSVSGIAASMAHGALLGARGNSGVILSQIFRGVALAINDRESLNGRDLANALRQATELAYKAVLQPVEGTMLTVMRGASDRASSAETHSSSLLAVLAAAVEGGREALEATPEQLDILRQAGVVDAGGRGIVLILEGFLRFAHGETSIEDLQVNTGTPGTSMAFLDDIEAGHGDDASGYCTNFMVYGSEIDFDRVRTDIAAMGESAVIVGDSETIKVHLHTESPGDVLVYAVRLGDVDQIKIDNMTRQTEELARQRATRQPPKTPSAAHAEPIHGSIAIVAVASGDGLAAALLSMGANRIVHGGQTMNPSTEDLLGTIENLPVNEIVLLPNNSNILMAARQVVELSDKSVRVVPSVSVPHALAALAAFTPDATLDQNAGRMTDALGTIHNLELTRAIRDAEIEGVDISNGQVIGLIDGKLIAAGDDISSVARQLFDQAWTESAELITIFSGEEATKSDITTVAHIAEACCGDAELEIQPGGQPHYLFVISVE